jgi:ribosome-associated protein
MNEPLPIREGVEIPAYDLAYTFSRSGGPGGQHVNTTDTRVRLRFSLRQCSALPQGVKARLRAAHPGWMTNDGALVLTADSYRSRHRNIEEVRERLVKAIHSAWSPPKRRKKTRPSRGSVKRRLDGKKRRGEVKKGRGRVRDD